MFPNGIEFCDLDANKPIKTSLTQVHTRLQTGLQLPDCSFFFGLIERVRQSELTSFEPFPHPF